MKTRFAPSPTGFLHVGGLRTALFNYLRAKKEGGTFLLRIEDTDRERFVEGGVENILSALDWAGMSPYEGVCLEKGHVVQKGNLGPYIQSERLEIYKEHIAKLIENGHAYHCFCSKERLDELRKVQQLNKQATGYDGLCRDLDPAEASKRASDGESHVIRLTMPREGETSFTDEVRGDVTFENKLIDDQVLMKADGFPTYHFAVVVDDHLMEVTHVIRGEEWVSSTPKHIALYAAFGWDAPTYAHLPLLVNEQKAKLSKRHGDVSVEDFKEKGYLPEALVNFIAFLGWNPGDEREIFSIGELEKEFDIAKVSKSAAVFNREKLDWYNKQYIANMNAADLAKKAAPFFQNAGIASEQEYIEKVVTLEQGRANTLVELVESTGFMFADKLDYDPELLVWKKSTKEETKQKLGELLDFLQSIDDDQWNKEGLEEKVMPWIKEKGYGNGDVLWPMRAALSGQKNSPGPFDIAAALGKGRVVERMEAALGMM